MHMAWTQEQRRQYDALRYLLDTCDPYLEPLSNTEPWYDSISTGNVKEDKDCQAHNDCYMDSRYHHLL